MSARTQHVRRYIERVASQDIEEFPDWDLKCLLPRLPIPTLSDTLNKYLLCIQPIVTPAQYEATRHLVAEFGCPGGAGEYLQQKLQEYADTVENWVSQFWLDDMYLKVQLPLPVNSNPGMVFPRQKFADQDAQLRFAARLISGILDYKVIIDSRSLPIDRARHRAKGQPLCMEQYYRLFTTYRVPGVTKDVLVRPDESSMQEPEHVVVICKNQFFVLDVVVNFTRPTVDDLFTQLKRIVNTAEDEQSDAERVGILTSGRRDDWARARMRLMQDSTNRDCLDTIERCIFVLCLDNAVHEDDADSGASQWRDDVSLALQMVHGSGVVHNTCNRWFDKTMQFVIGEDGACGLCYEHSPSEGIAVVQLIEHMLQYMEEVRKCKLPRWQSICELPLPRKLRWQISVDTRDDIARIISSTDKALEDMDMHILRFSDYGKDFPKKQNMSPDAFIQLALQLSYYTVHRRLVSTYESASIRRFRLGRVDNIRACTLEALSWARAMTGETEATDEQKMQLLREAMKRQTEILVQTILGYGIDNHLLGLKKIAEDVGRDCPTIFIDESYCVANHFTMSTSQVPTTMDAFMCYAPVVPDGYGICYNPHPDYILVCISSFKSSDATESAFLAATLESSMMQMKELCIKIKQSPPSKSVSAGLQKETAAQNNNNGAGDGKLAPKGNECSAALLTDSSCET